MIKLSGEKTIFPNLLKFLVKDFLLTIFCVIFKSKWNWKFFQGWFLIRNKGITFEAWNMLTCQLLSFKSRTLEACFLEKISTFFGPSFSCLIQRFRTSVFLNQWFFVFSNWVIVLDSLCLTKARCTTFGTVLKIKILSWSGSCRILHSFDKFSIFKIDIL